MRLHGHLSEADLNAALLREFAEAGSRPSQRLLPPTPADHLIREHSTEIANWLGAQIADDFTCTPEIVVQARKPGHGTRPLAIWELRDRAIYAALSSHLDSKLKTPIHEKLGWDRFQRSALDDDGAYVLVTDIASFYEYIDHELLQQQLLQRTGLSAAALSVTSLLRSTTGRKVGIPQQCTPSDILADAYIDVVERRLLRRGYGVRRYSDDFRVTCDTWLDVLSAVEAISEEARRVGLVINDAKTFTYGRETYETSLDQPELFREEILHSVDLDPADLPTMDGYPGNEEDEDSYDDEIPDDDTDRDDAEDNEPPQEIPLEKAEALLERWRGVNNEVLSPNVQLTARELARYRSLLRVLKEGLSVFPTVTSSTIINRCVDLLQSEASVTPWVGNYLASLNPEDLERFHDELISRDADDTFLSDWQRLWILHAYQSSGFVGTNFGSKARNWTTPMILDGRRGPIVRAVAAYALAECGRTTAKDINELYETTSAIVQPTLVVALYKLEANSTITRSTRNESLLHNILRQAPHE